jgi:hypothetical protein
MSKPNSYRIVISVRQNGILVERQYNFGADNWKTIDRYNTSDLTAEIRRSDPWIAQVLDLCRQPSAEVHIAIPRIPPLEPTQAERLQEYEKQARELEMLAQHDAEFKHGESFTGQAFQCTDRAERYEL